MGDFALVDPEGWEFDLQARDMFLDSKLSDAQFCGVLVCVLGVYWPLPASQHRVVREELGQSFYELRGVLGIWMARNRCHRRADCACAHCDTAHKRRRVLEDGENAVRKLRFFSVLSFSSCHRFGESLPTVANIVRSTRAILSACADKRQSRVEPFETTQRHLRTVADGETYRRLHNTLPAAAQGALKARIRAGEHASIARVWAARDRAFLAVASVPSERPGAPREWGYAALRAPHVDM